MNRRNGRMVQIADLIAELQELHRRFGNTCCHVTGLAWGSNALWSESDYRELNPDSAKGESNYASYLAQERVSGEGKPEGTRESLERCAKMLETYGPDLYPANELGQVDFARAMMDSVVGEVRAFLEATK